MSDCSRLSDRIPAVALGRAEWTPEEAGHLDDCRSCRDEWELVQATSRLGERLGLQYDHASIAKAVLHRLQHKGKQAHLRPPVWTFAGLAAAAAVVAVVWMGSPDGSPDSPDTESVVAGRLQIRLPELESLQAAELDSVLQTMDEPVVGGPTVADPGLADLDSDELQRVLDSWEG